MTRNKAHDHLTGYEPFEERIGPVVKFTVALAAVTVLVLGLMKLASRRFAGGAREGSHPIHSLAESGTREMPPEPRLQETPALDLERFRAREQERLTTYGWVDRPAGVVRIPVERAMELVVREGLPVRERSPR